MSYETFFLPTLKACRDYNVARVPTRGHPARDTTEEINDLKEKRGTLDFIRFGRQFSDNWMKRTFQRITGSDVPPLYRNLLLRSSQGNSEGNDEDEISTLHIDEIIIEAIGNIPYIVEFKDGQRVYKTGEKRTGEFWKTSVYNKEEILANFRIMVEDESYKINHSHQWEPPGGNIISQVLDTATDIGNRVERATSAATDSEGNFRPLKNFKLDIADRYAGSTLPELTFTFNLFTKDDFIDDIFMPLMLLSYYSSPKRQGSGVGDVIKSVISSITSALGEEKELKERIEEEFNEATIDDNNLNILNKIHPGFRLLITEPPSFFKVRHSSGIFDFPKMAMTEITYKFKKPFYNTKLENVTTNMFNSVTKRQEKSFPTHAEVRIKMEALDPMFAEDFSIMMKNFNPEYSEKINILFDDNDEKLLMRQDCGSLLSDVIKKGVDKFENLLIDNPYDGNRVQGALYYIQSDISRTVGEECLWEQLYPNVIQKEDFLTSLIYDEVDKRRG